MVQILADQLEFLNHNSTTVHENNINESYHNNKFEVVQIEGQSDLEIPN